jgi:hypothetical protein
MQSNATGSTWPPTSTSVIGTINRGEPRASPAWYQYRNRRQRDSDLKRSWGRILAEIGVKPDRRHQGQHLGEQNQDRQKERHYFRLFSLSSPNLMSAHSPGAIAVPPALSSHASAGGPHERSLPCPQPITNELISVARFFQVERIGNYDARPSICLGYLLAEYTGCRAHCSLSAAASSFGSAGARLRGGGRS